MASNTKEYIKESIFIFGEPMCKGVNTTAEQKIFTVGESTLLDQTKAEKLYQIVTTLLYVYKRERVDIELSVSFF